MLKFVLRFSKSMGGRFQKFMTELALTNKKRRYAVCGGSLQPAQSLSLVLPVERYRHFSVSGLLQNRRLNLCNAGGAVTASDCSAASPTHKEDGPCFNS